MLRLTFEMLVESVNSAIKLDIHTLAQNYTLTKNIPTS